MQLVDFNMLFETAQDLRKRLDGATQTLNEFPDVNDKKYDLPDGWTNEDLADKYQKVISDSRKVLEKMRSALKGEPEK